MNTVNVIEDITKAILTKVCTVEEIDLLKSTEQIENILEFVYIQDIIFGNVDVNVVREYIRRILLEVKAVRII